MYEFQKMYADVVAPDGTVCVVYQTWVRLLRAWHARSGIELYRPDGTRTVLIGEGAAEPPPLDAPVARCPMSLRVDGGSFELALDEDHGGFEPGPACPGLEWSVKLGAARMRARGPGIDIAGCGYVDLVRLTRATRFLGLRELGWGRTHAGPATLVWTALDFVDGTRWCAGAWWEGNRSQHGGVEVELDGRGRGSVVVADRPISIVPVRVIHDGDAFDRERIPALADRLVTRAIGGATHQVRWQGQATDLRSRQSGDALYERVRFGRFRPVGLNQESTSEVATAISAS